MSVELSTGEKLALGGGLLAVLGALLPWTGPGLFDGFGLESGRAIVVLLLGIVVFGVIYVADWTETVQLIVVLIGAGTAAVAAVTLVEAFGIVGDGSASASVGLYVTVLAGVIILAGGAHGYTDSTPEAGMYSHR